jgi:hypothetical protein
MNDTAATCSPTLGTLQPAAPAPSPSATSATPANAHPQAVPRQDPTSTDPRQLDHKYEAAAVRGRSLRGGVVRRRAGSGDGPDASSNTGPDSPVGGLSPQLESLPEAMARAAPILPAWNRAPGCGPQWSRRGRVADQADSFALALRLRLWLGCLGCALGQQIGQEHHHDGDPDANQGERHPQPLLSKVGGMLAARPRSAASRPRPRCTRHSSLSVRPLPARPGQ